MKFIVMIFMTILEIPINFVITLFAACSSIIGNQNLNNRIHTFFEYNQSGFAYKLLKTVSIFIFTLPFLAELIMECATLIIIMWIGNFLQSIKGLNILLIPVLALLGGLFYVVSIVFCTVYFVMIIPDIAFVHENIYDNFSVKQS